MFYCSMSQITRITKRPAFLISGWIFTLACPSQHSRRAGGRVSYAVVWGRVEVDQPLLSFSHQSVWAVVSVKLVVQAKGKPTPQVEWFKENRLARRVKRVELQTEGDKNILLIPKAVPEDSGNYRVEATNPAGTTVKAFIVKVNGRFCWLKEAQSRNFKLFWPRTKLPLNWRKTGSNSLLR